MSAVVRALPGQYLLVSSNGDLIAMSGDAERLLGLVEANELPSLRDVSADPEPIPDYLEAASRSRSPLAGTMALRTASDPVRRFLCSASPVRLPDSPDPLLLLQLRETMQGPPSHPGGNGSGNRARAELRESEERFRATFDQAAVGMAHVDLAGRWLRVNERLCEIVGYTKHELYDLNFQAITHPDDLPRDLAHVSRLVSGETDSYAMEKRYIRKDGRVVWIHLTVSLVRTPAGAPKYFIAVIRDIDERRQIEAEVAQKHDALLRERQRLKAVLDVLPAGVWIASAAGQIVEANRAAAELWGGRAPGRTTSAGDDPGYDAFWPDGTPLGPGDWGLERALDGERTGPQEVMIAFPDGTRRTILNYGIPIRDEEDAVAGAVALSVDITQSKRIEKSLRRATGQLGVLVRAANGLLAVERPVDLLDDIMAELRASIGVEVCMHYRVDDAAGDRPARLHLEASIGVPVDVVRESQSIAMDGSACGVVARDRRTFVAENVQADGGDLLRTVRSFGVTAYVCHPLIVADRLLGTLGFGLRGRTAFEDHELDLLRALADQLAVAIHRAGVLQSEQRARMEAEAASNAKTAFMATLSHELRTPLNATIGYADLLADGIPEPVPAASRRHVDRIGVASRHLLQLIEELLTFSRLEAGREPTYVENVLMADLINEVRVVAEPLAANAGLAFHIDTADAPRIVATDPRKLRQILLNLIGNAVKFTTEGTVTLTVREEAGSVLFGVTDTGMGITRENQTRLFEPFWQVDSSRTRRSPGTGLGLTISRRYAQLLGGDVTVESVPDVGSAFTLRIPV